MPTKEATSRLQINKLLEEAGWVLDPSSSKCNVLVESNTKISSIEVNEFGDNFENVTKRKKIS